jgi:hypothetical protein
MMWRLGCAALLTIWAGGCAGSRAVASSEDQPLFAAGWTGPAPHVNVTLSGPDASADKQARCRGELVRAGAIVDEGGAAWAQLNLAPGATRLQVTTRRRGVVRDEARADASVERLCNDALYALVVALRAEQPATTASVPAGPSNVPPGFATPPPAYSRMPPPKDRTGDMPADQPIPSPTASGGINQGPIPPQ